MFATKNTCYVLICVAALSSNRSYSQLSSVPRWEAGINAGAYIYQGDLTPHRFGSIETTMPGFGISGTRIISRLFSARLMFNMAWLHANESIYKYPDWRQQRNLAFSASMKELTATFHWNIFGTNYTDDVRYEPYVFAGAGVSFSNISRDYSRINLAYFGESSDVQRGLAVDAVTPAPRVIPVVPVGAGVRYHISDRIVLNLEGTYRLMHNDYLDGFSQVANPKLKDHYSSLTIGAAYKFGKKEKYGCPSLY